MPSRSAAALSLDYGRPGSWLEESRELLNAGRDGLPKRRIRRPQPQLIRRSGEPLLAQAHEDLLLDRSRIEPATGLRPAAVESARRREPARRPELPLPPPPGICPPPGNCPKRPFVGLPALADDDPSVTPMTIPPIASPARTAPAATSLERSPERAGATASRLGAQRRCGRGSRSGVADRRRQFGHRRSRAHGIRRPAHGRRRQLARRSGWADHEQPHAFRAPAQLVQQVGLEDCGDAQAADSQPIDRGLII